MPLSLRTAALAIGIATAPLLLGAQGTGLTPAERRSTVDSLSTLLEAHYVFPAVAATAVADLQARFTAGELDQADAEGFANALTTTLQGTTHDKHLRVQVRVPERAEVERTDPDLARAQRTERARTRNYGFQRVEVLDGNIGYVDMSYFDGSEPAKPVAAAAMNFLANTDAVIFDMRNNGGGSPEMIRYVSSWFFAKPTHLNSLYFREGDRTIESWTLADIPGTARPEVPVFVLTSARSFSGAEEFSYNMRTQGRGTLIGEVTGGGANPGRTVPINERFEVFIPGGTAINPITHTNWEGVGVEPHVAVPADSALTVAVERATVAAKAYRTRMGRPGGA
jgi:C-terminal processing protease CtpA/Prc